eukprot:2162565-Rhodomonas_salina.2
MERMRPAEAARGVSAARGSPYFLREAHSLIGKTIPSARAIAVQQSSWYTLCQYRACSATRERLARASAALSFAKEEGAAALTQSSSSTSRASTIAAPRTASCSTKFRSAAMLCSCVHVSPSCPHPPARDPRQHVTRNARAHHALHILGVD